MITPEFENLLKHFANEKDRKQQSKRLKVIRRASAIVDYNHALRSGATTINMKNNPYPVENEIPNMTKCQMEKINAWKNLFARSIEPN